VITSGLVGLRARQEADVAILHAELYDDVVTHSRGDTRAWRPVNVSSDSSPYAVGMPTDKEVSFSVVELASGDLVGDAVVWNIDAHNRSAHLGVTLRPSFRGRGLGLETVRALCLYGFDFLGLHRLQIETLTDNHAMIAAAEKAGFTREGVMREDAWVLGEFVSDVVYGLLDHEYRQL
jgi:RimJ/RimL family protein N-acetyltransferase